MRGVSSGWDLSARPEHDGARRGRAKILQDFMRDQEKIPDTYPTYVEGIFIEAQQSSAQFL